MPAPDGVQFAGFDELFSRVRANRLEQSISRLTDFHIGDDQRARNELRYEVDHRVFVDSFVGRDGRRGFDGERGGKDRDATQDSALVFGVQVVAPVEGLTQRLLPWQGSTRAASTAGVS